MTLLFMDSFQYGSSEIGYKWSNTRNASIQSLTRRVGATYSLYLTDYPWGGYVQFTPVSNMEGVILGVAVYLNQGMFGPEGTLVSIPSLGVSINTNAAFGFNLVTPAGTVVSAPSLFNYNTWFYLELKYVKSATIGAAILRINEIVVAEKLNQNFNSAASLISLQIDYTQGHKYFQDCYICDGLGITNNDFLGDIRVDVCRPNAPGTHTDFTPSAGANWENVDEVDFDGNTSYNDSKVVGAKDTYNLDTLSPTGQEIYGIQQCSIIRKTDASAKYGKQLIKSNATEDLGEELPFNNSFTGYQRILEQDPDTETTWDEAGINALESGLTVTTPV